MKTDEKKQTEAAVASGLPIVTNRLRFTCDREAFFAKYSIISYCSNAIDKKCLAYERLGKIDNVISVTGIDAEWDKKCTSYRRFFILTERDKRYGVLKSLSANDNIACCLDNLEKYGEPLANRIISSLAINSLGGKSDKRMYNGGCLFICDTGNFGISPKNGLVCLKIEVNRYMILTAKTATFNNPINEKEALNPKYCLFHKSNIIDGENWCGKTLKPIVITPKNIKDYKLEDLYISKKYNQNHKNIVPYWPFDEKKYSNGKLFALTQIVNDVNKSFASLLKIDFEEYPHFYYDAHHTGKEMLSLLEEELKGRNIFIEDPFKEKGSKEMIGDLKKSLQTIMKGNLVFSRKQSPNDIVIKLCKPKDDSTDSTYERSLQRAYKEDVILQHIVYTGNATDDKITDAEARRILIEILIKKGNVERVILPTIAAKLVGWTFYRYKVVGKDFVHGASLTVDKSGIMNITTIGLSQYEYGEDFHTFCQENLLFNDPEKINSHKDYVAIRKRDNVYLIIDTDEIPILDAHLIAEKYDSDIVPYNKQKRAGIQNPSDGVSVSSFKNKTNFNNHRYLRDYVGLHVWKTDGLFSEEGRAYSYFSGFNSDNLKIVNSGKIDKMPRARRIFVLHEGDPAAVESEIRDMMSMLEFGAGRWDELDTYPFPFKYLKEHLDTQALIAKSL